MRLGIAKRLRIGNAMLANVVFYVLPDSDWRIPRSYHVSAIIGLPVLMALGRLQFVNSAAPTLSYDVSHGRSAGRAGPHSNMLLSGLDPLVLVRVPGAVRPLRMELDTGADRTDFTHDALAKSPALSAHVEPYVWQGVGGTKTGPAYDSGCAWLGGRRMQADAARGALGQEQRNQREESRQHERRAGKVARRRVLANEQREYVGEERGPDDAGQALQARQRALQTSLFPGVDLVRNNGLRGRLGQPPQA